MFCTLFCHIQVSISKLKYLCVLSNESKPFLHSCISRHGFFVPKYIISPLLNLKIISTPNYLFLLTLLIHQSILCRYYPFLCLFFSLSIINLFIFCYQFIPYGGSTMANENCLSLKVFITSIQSALYSLMFPNISVGFICSFV